MRRNPQYLNVLFSSTKKQLLHLITRHFSSLKRIHNKVYIYSVKIHKQNHFFPVNQITIFNTSNFWGIAATERFLNYQDINYSGLIFANNALLKI